MANLNFRQDLKLGNEGEESVIKFLETKGLKYISSNNDNKYDLKMGNDENEITYEIKTDVKCAPLFDTGNIFIEFESRGKPSGIQITQADWFVTYFKYLNELWFIKSEKLKELIKENDFPVFKDAGDIGSATHGYLIKRKDFKKYFYVCKI
jgi:hypothetical protein